MFVKMNNLFQRNISLIRGRALYLEHLSQYVYFMGLSTSACSKIKLVRTSCDSGLRRNAHNGHHQPYLLHDERITFVRFLHVSNAQLQSVKEKSRDSTATSALEQILNDEAHTKLPSTRVEKAVQAGQDATYAIIIVIGVLITGALGYYVFSELFSSNSPSKIYSNAYKLASSDSKVIDVLGEPIKGYGETTRRGRRRHVSHLEYEKDGFNLMRLKFYMEGSRQKATVNLEMVKDERGKYDYRYLFVAVNSFPERTIVLIDNR